MDPRPLLSTDIPALLVKLGAWIDHDDAELPRAGYGYRTGMSDGELYTSARAWWRLSIERASRYRYAVAVHDGVAVGVWELDPAGWRSWVDPSVGRSRMRWSFSGVPASPEVERAFVGWMVPRLRRDGRHVFGSGAAVAYWP